MKPTSQIVLVDNAAVDNRGDVEDVIRSGDYPLGEQERSDIEDLIEAEATMLEQAVTRRKHEAREQAGADLKQVQAQRSAHAPDVASAEARLASSPPGSWILAAIMTPFFLACLGMEFILSWVTLTLLLGVEPYSVLGIMLGVGPTGAVAVLKIIIARLFEEPYQQLRMPGAASRAHRIAVLGAMVLFLVAVGVFNVYTVVLQAEVREAVSVAAHDLLSDDVAEPSQPIDSRGAVVAISVAAALDGAIFFLFAWNEGRNWKRRRTSLKEVERTKRRAQELEVAVAQAEATVAMRMQEDVDRAAKVAGGRRRAELRVALHQEASRQIQARTSVAATARRMRAAV